MPQERKLYFLILLLEGERLETKRIQKLWGGWKCKVWMKGVGSRNGEKIPATFSSVHPGMRKSWNHTIRNSASEIRIKCLHGSAFQSTKDDREQTSCSVSDDNCQDQVPHLPAGSLPPGCLPLQLTHSDKWEGLGVYRGHPYHSLPSWLSLQGYKLCPRQRQAGSWRGGVQAQPHWGGLRALAWQTTARSPSSQMNLGLCST